MKGQSSALNIRYKHFTAMWYAVHPKKGLIYKNYKLINAQKNIIAKMLTQIGINLFSGKGIMTTSLPVDIFDKISML